MKPQLSPTEALKRRLQYWRVQYGNALHDHYRAKQGIKQFAHFDFEVFHNVANGGHGAPQDQDSPARPDRRGLNSNLFGLNANYFAQSPTQLVITIATTYEILENLLHRADAGHVIAENSGLFDLLDRHINASTAHDLYESETKILDGLLRFEQSIETRLAGIEFLRNQISRRAIRSVGDVFDQRSFNSIVDNNQDLFLKVMNKRRDPKSRRDPDHEQFHNAVDAWNIIYAYLSETTEGVALRLACEPHLHRAFPHRADVADRTREPAALVLPLFGAFNAPPERDLNKEIESSLVLGMNEVKTLIAQIERDGELTHHAESRMQLWLDTTVHLIEKQSLYSPAELRSLGRDQLADARLRSERADEIRERIRESKERFVKAGINLAEDLSSVGLEFQDFAPLSDNPRMLEVRKRYGF